MMNLRFAHALAISTMAFLTLVDLFATQAILPSLAGVYHSSAMATGLAVNATTIGMAFASLGVAILSSRINRRAGIAVSLCALAAPTALLAFAPNLVVFACLRVAQGLCMASAFALTLAHLGEHTSEKDAAGAFAAYVTGNVASNLLGRLAAAAFVHHLGVAGNFLVFAALNLLGAALAASVIERAPRMRVVDVTNAHPLAIWRRHLEEPALRAAFGVGFCILFAFVGTFTYVNFVLARPPFGLGMMQIGLVYLVFAPSLLTTPLAGRVVVGLGARNAVWLGLAVACLGAALLLASEINLVLAGLALVGVGTFFAQAVATGFVGRAAKADRGGAGGLYLASYFAGGLAGAWTLGLAFDRLGWIACVAGVALALMAACLLAARFSLEPRAVVVPAT
jgi:YNFM family putative membrane transporter